MSTTGFVSTFFFLCFLSGTAAAQKVGDSGFLSLPHYLHLKKIILSGKTKTRATIVLRELSVQPNDSFPASEIGTIIKVNTARLYSLSLFNEVKISTEKAGYDSINLLVRLSDRFPVFPEGSLEFADRNFNSWWEKPNRKLNRINLGLTLTDNNLGGKRELLQFIGQVGFTQKIGFVYSIPFIDKKQNQGIGISVFGLQNREIAYNTVQNKLVYFRDSSTNMLRRFDLNLFYTYRPGYAVTQTLSAIYQHYWISSKADSLNADYLGNSQQQANILWLQYKLVWNQVDNWNYPLTGQRFIGIVNEKLLVGGKQFQTELHVEYSRYFHPLRNWYGSLIFRGRFSFPQQQPYIFRQNLGYDYDYLRGFEYYVIDGSAFALERVDLKRSLWNHRFRLPVRYFEVIPVHLYAKIFGDVGYSVDQSNNTSDFLSNRWLYSGGFGIDLVTLYDIKFRIEYTWNSLGEKGLFLHKKGE